MNKYAGMGNATTFPVQSVVFSLIAIAAILEYEGKIPSFGNARRVARNVRVFGDDIIIKTEHYPLVTSWLTSLGLVVNSQKSYSTGKFRESCGLDAYDGYDVTPTYLPCPPSELTSKNTAALDGLVSFSNQCWLKGLYKTATFIRKQVESSIKRRLPLVTSKSSCHGWHTRNDAFEFQRWNTTLHRFEVESLVTFTKSVKDPLNGYAALLKFFSTPLLGRPVGHLERSKRRYNTYHRLRWVQSP
jgi:hypothetical protein